MALEEQREELEVLQSIYDERLVGMMGMRGTLPPTAPYPCVELSRDPMRIKITGIVGDGVGIPPSQGKDSHECNPVFHE